MLRIALLGDIALFSDGTLSEDWHNKIKTVKAELEKYDLVVANLEVPITRRKRTMVCKGIHLKTTPDIIDVLKELNVSVVSLANNHMCDFGLGGMRDTIRYLEEANIPYYGVNGRFIDINKNGENLRFYGYCCYSANGACYVVSGKKKGIHALTKDRIIAELKDAETAGYLSILSMHWGDEYSQLPNERQVDFMHDISSKYSFVLHGHHTHVMQGIEKNNKALLVYSQGNFCFDEVHSAVNNRLIIKQSIVNKESYIVGITISDGEIIDFNTIGILNDDVICLIDNSMKVKELSEKIEHCKEDAYKSEAREMIRVQKAGNLGKKDFKWLLSKLNYYSIGAKILWYWNDFRYKKAF